MLILDIIAFVVLVNDEMARLGIITAVTARECRAVFNLTTNLAMVGAVPNDAENASKFLETAHAGLRMIRGVTVCNGLHCGNCQFDALLDEMDELLVRTKKLIAQEQQAFLDRPRPTGVHMN